MEPVSIAAGPGALEALLRLGISGVFLWLFLRMWSDHKELLQRALDIQAKTSEAVAHATDALNRAASVEGHVVEAMKGCAARSGAIEPEGGRADRTGAPHSRAGETAAGGIGDFERRGKTEP